MSATLICVSHPQDLGRREIQGIAVQGWEVRVSEQALQAVASRRTKMLEALRSSDVVYGVNTGMGRMSGYRLSPEEQRAHQYNLLLGRAVGGPPWLKETDVRALLAVRLRHFLNGHAGVSPDLCRFLASRLNDGFLPAVPSTGVGSAGEVMPLAHAFQTFCGVGLALEGDATIPAGEALARRDATRYKPDIKEGIALLAGDPGATALALMRAATTRLLTEQLVITCAAAVDALGAPTDPYDPRLGELSTDEVLTDILRRLSRFLGGDRSPHMLQAPVSYRVAPQVLTHVERNLADLERAVDRELRSVSDSPVDLDGRFIATSGFHSIELAGRMDALAAALAHAGEIVVQRLGRLLDERFSGLPAQLSPDPGAQSGLVVVHKRAVGALHHLRSMLGPHTSGLIETSAGQEDAMTFAWQAAMHLEGVLDGVREVMACELLAIRQAWGLRKRTPQGPLATLNSELERLVAMVDSDRPLGPDIGALVDALRDGRLPSK